LGQRPRAAGPGHAGSLLDRCRGRPPTRSIIMFLGPLLHRAGKFQLPYAGGCDLGTRTVEPHLSALRHFGLDVVATDHHYQATTSSVAGPRRPIVLTERGDTVTENAL